MIITIQVHDYAHTHCWANTVILIKNRNLWDISIIFIIVEQYGDILSTSLGRATTNPLEPAPAQPPQIAVSTPENSDMAELFRKLGLDKYTDLFLQQEVFNSVVYVIVLWMW